MVEATEESLTKILRLAILCGGLRMTILNTGAFPNVPGQIAMTKGNPVENPVQIEMFRIQLTEDAMPPFFH